MSQQLVVQRLLDAGSATLHEAQAQVGALGPAVRPMWSGATTAGPAQTVRIAAGDNLGVHVALESAQPGSVLVVASRGRSSHGFWGAVLTEYALAQGVVGLITDLFVRDIEAITNLGFAVFARGASIEGTGKDDRGLQQVPIVVGGALIKPGDYVVGDADGCVVIRKDRLVEVLAAAEARVSKETRAIERIRRGESTRSVLGL